MTRTRTVTTDEDQRVTFVELFFDLVFVYAVTQLVALLHHELSWAGAARAVLVFWLVWWAWTQFTWALHTSRWPWVSPSASVEPRLRCGALATGRSSPAR